AVCGTNSRNRPRHPARSALGPRPAKPTTPPSCLQEISAIAAQLQELRHRLQTAAALTPPLEDATSAYGFTCAPEQVVSFWRTSTSGRSARPSSTRCAQFKTQVGGLQLHFIHAKPKQVPAGARVLPLLLAARLAGLRARVLRAHPAADGGAAGRGLRVRGGGASLPGYGFSEGAPSGPGPRADGRALPRPHGAPGPQACFGLSHDCVLSQHDDVANQADTRWILSNKVHERRRRQEGVALRDSPAGLAAYILEKFSTWTEKDWRSLPDGGLTKKFTLTKLLDNVMIYWISGSITTSMRLYSEFFSSKNMALQLDSVPTDVPTAFANFPNEIGFTPEFIAADKYERIVHFSHPPRGGHFPALEEPRLLADDIWDAFPKLLRAAADRAQHKAK
ncbi:Juvenile hormone epoxide hydrolase 2, partial [Gryllus bimaculatus]